MDNFPVLNILMQTNKLCPATRKSDGMHVMLCLICKGDAGHDELNILRYFSQPDLADNPANHVIPLLGEIHHLDMIFAVLPLMSVNTILWPAFHDWSELLDAMEQTFEVRGDFLVWSLCSSHGSCYLQLNLKRHRP